MNPQKNSRWNWHSTGWVLGVLTLSAAYALLLGKPQLLRLRALDQDVAERQAEVASRAQWLDTLAQANREVAGLARSVADFEQRIPAQPELGGFLEDLARAAQKRHLQSDTIQPGEPVRSAEVVALPIAIQVRGPFSAVHGFVQDIEQMPRLTKFDEFKVAVDDEHPGMVKGNMNLKVYYGVSPQGAKSG